MKREMIKNMYLKVITNIKEAKETSVMATLASTSYIKANFKLK